MKTNTKINLSFETSASRIPQSISSKQFDNLTRTLTVRFGKEIPEESVVVLRGTKPDSTIFELVGKRINDYEYLFEFTESALSVSGRIVCDVNCTLFENGVAKTCSTEIFFIENISSAVKQNGKEDDRVNTVPLLIENALSDAKESGIFDGKSAYQYALDGGYEGSEEDFSKKLAQETATNGIPANAVMKSVSGSVLRMEDVINEGQKLKANVKTKNLLPIMPTQTINGMLFTVYGDGKIAMSGTTTAETLFVIPLALSANTYTFSMNNPAVFGGEIVRVVVYSKTGSTICTVTPDAVNKTHIFKATNEIGSIAVVLSAGVGLNDFIIKPQLELGSSASPYTPMIDTANVKCSVFGKNLLPPLKQVQTVNGHTITPNPDGTFVVEGSISSTEKTVFDLALLDENGERKEVRLRAGEVYLLSLFKDGITNSTFKNEIYYPDTDETVCVSTLGDKNRERVLRRVYVERTLSKGNTSLNGVYSIQLELGSTKSNHERYIKTEYTSDENGFIEFPWLAPTTTVQPEIEGAFLELTYPQDTNSALNGIITVIRALGGNI